MSAKRHTYLPSGNSEKLGVAEGMGSTGETVKLLHALANESRLQILDCMRNGIKNPGQMSKKLKRHRSTIEKHLCILLKANIIEKIPSLTTGGQLSVRYEISRNREQTVNDHSGSVRKSLSALKNLDQRNRVSI